MHPRLTHRLRVASARQVLCTSDPYRRPSIVERFPIVRIVAASLLLTAIIVGVFALATILEAAQ